MRGSRASSPARSPMRRRARGAGRSQPASSRRSSYSSTSRRPCCAPSERDRACLGPAGDAHAEPGSFLAPLPRLARRLHRGRVVGGADPARSRVPARPRREPRRLRGWAPAPVAPAVLVPAAARRRALDRARTRCDRRRRRRRWDQPLQRAGPVPLARRARGDLRCPRRRRRPALRLLPHRPDHRALCRAQRHARGGPTRTLAR